MSTRRARENDDGGGGDTVGPSDPRKRSRAATTTTTTEQQQVVNNGAAAPPPPVAVIPSTEALQSLLQSVNANKVTTTTTTTAAPGPPSIVDSRNQNANATTTTTTTATAPRDPRSRSSSRAAAAAVAAAASQQQQHVVMPQYGGVAAAPPPNVYGGAIPGLHQSTQRVPPPPPAQHQVVHTQQQTVYLQQPQTTTTTIVGAPPGTVQYAYPPPPPGQTTTTTGAVLSMQPPPGQLAGTAGTVPVSILRPGMILPANMPKELPIGHIIEQIPCPSENAGKVIGHGGEKINQLQQATKAIVKIQSSADVPKGAPRLITIAGAPECVRHAIEQLLPVVNTTKAPAGGVPVYQANMGAPQQQVLEIRIAVPDNMIGRVIGRGGETIKRISDESGARLQIERESNEVSAKGDASQLEIARMLIHDIVTAPVRQTLAAGAAGASGEAKPEYVVIEIDSQGQEGRIIGRGGENIRSMAMTSGAKIQIDKETKMIKISGFKDKVETAKHMLEAFMADYVPRDQQYQKSDDAAAAGATGAPIFGQTLEQQNAAAAHEASLKKEEEEKPLWETHQSPEGYTYYYNTTTGETQWEMPDDYDGFS